MLIQVQKLLQLIFLSKKKKIGRKIYQGDIQVVNKRHRQ